MTSWFAFHGYNNGKAIAASSTDYAELTPLGFHSYPTEAEAEAHPNSVPGFPNPLAAIAIPVVNAAIDDYNNARDISPTQANDPNNPSASGKAAAKQAGKAASGAANALKKLLPTGWVHNIEQWVVRGFEMILGVALIIVSLAKLASDTPVGKAAVKAGKAAAIL